MKYGILTSSEPLINRLLILLFVLLCLHPVTFGYAGPFEAESHQEGNKTPSVPSTEFIEFRSDIRLFTVMAAINVAGFDYEIPGKEMSEVRRLVRTELEGLSEELRSKLRDFYFSHHRSDDPDAQAAYTSLALLIDGPPDFGLQGDLPNVPDEARAVMGFESLLAEFYREGHIYGLWNRLADEYNEVLEAYKPVAETVIRRTLVYFRVSTRVILNSQIILMPDLLSFSDVVNARNQERTYYIVVGPAEDPESNFIQVQHEYLHFLIDPLMEKNGAVILATRDLLELAHGQPNIRSDFKEQFLLIVGESLVEAIQSRLHPPRDLEKRQVELFRRGLVFSPYFNRSLERFEMQTTASLPSYLRRMLEDMTVSEIKKDAELIEKSEAAILAREEGQRRQSEQEAAHRKQMSERRQMLADAGDLMSNGKYSEAEVLLRSLLEQEPDNGTAYFYLGQIAAQGRQHEAAFSHYQKAQASAQTQDWVKAWARVRMGRYLAHQGKFQDARRMFEVVVGMEGDLKGAKKEALELIGKLPED